MKYEDLYPDTEQLINHLLDVAGLNNLIDIKMLADNKQTKIIDFKKANKLNKVLGKYNLAIVINQRVFETLDEPTQILILQERLSGIHYDLQKDDLIINNYEIQTTAGFLDKYGWEQLKRTTDIVNASFAQIKEEDEQMKAAAKMGSKTKRG